MYADTRDTQAEWLGEGLGHRDGAMRGMSYPRELRANGVLGRSLTLQRSDPVGGVPCPAALLDAQWHWAAPESVKLSPSTVTNSQSYLFGCRLSSSTP